jgi:hypothetical protein
MKLPRDQWIQYDFVLKEPNIVSFTAKRCELKPGVKLDPNLKPMSGNVPLLMMDFFVPKTPAGKERKDPNDPNVTIIQVVS